MEATKVHGDAVLRIDYTPSGAAVSAGEVVKLGDGITGVCTSPEGIADGALGSLEVQGSVFDLTKDGTSGPVFSVGERVDWDFTANLAIEAAAPSATVAAFGVCVKAAGTNEATVRVMQIAGVGLIDHILAQAAVVAALTDNSAGTANDTVQALADGTTYANDVAAIRNNFADLAAKVNAVLTSLKTAGLMASA